MIQFASATGASAAGGSAAGAACQIQTPYIPERARDKRPRHYTFQQNLALLRRYRAGTVDSRRKKRVSSNTNRTPIEEIQENEQHNISGGFFNDALSWVLDKVPFRNWLWPVGPA